MSTQSPAVTSANPVLSKREINLVIVGLMAAMFLSSLNQTVVGTAMRTIADDLQGLDQQAWVTTAFLITSTVMTPIYGKLSDIFGRRPLFIVAIVIFLAGSVLAGFSTSMYMLAGFRAIQGIGAGGLMALPLTVMGDILAPRERAKYQGYFLAVFGVSSVLGPLVGGLFAGADTILGAAGWRWVFFINLPVGAAALFMVARFLHLPKHHHNRVAIDWWGAVTIVLGVVPLLLVAEQGREWGWTSPAAWACYIVGVLGLIAFVLVERAMGDAALIPLKLFKSPTFSMATVLGVLVGFGMFGAMMSLPLYLQLVLGASPTESGWWMIPMVLGLMVSSIVSGQVIARTGKYKPFVVIGPAFLIAAFYLLTFSTYDKPLWFTMIGMVLVGLGLGMLMQTLTIASQNAVQARDMGVATSAATFFRQMGGTVGVAVIFSVLFSRVTDTIKDAFTNKALLGPALDAALDPSVAGDPKNAGIMDAVYGNITPEILDTVNQQMADATAQVTDAVTAQVTQAVQAMVDAGQLPAAAAQAVIEQQVQAALPGALQSAADQAGVSVIDGALSVDWSNAGQRGTIVDGVLDKLDPSSLQGGAGGGDLGSSLNGDTSFLTGSDPRLTAPLLDGFANATVTVFWVSLGVMVVAFLLSFFLKATPLREKSAAQEAADEHAAAEQFALEAQVAANEAGVAFEPPAFAPEEEPEPAPAK